MFTGTSRVLIPNTGTVPFLKIVLGWRLACILFCTIPQTLRPGSRLIVVYFGIRRGWGIAPNMHSESWRFPRSNTHLACGQHRVM